MEFRTRIMVESKGNKSLQPRVEISVTATSNEATSLRTRSNVRAQSPHLEAEDGAAEAGAGAGVAAECPAGAPWLTRRRQFGRTRDLLCRPPEHARRWRWRRRSLKKRELVRRGESRSIRISSRRGRPASRAASHTRTHSATSQAKRTELTGALRASRES